LCDHKPVHRFQAHAKTAFFLKKISTGNHNSDRFSFLTFLPIPCICFDSKTPYPCFSLQQKGAAQVNLLEFAELAIGQHHQKFPLSAGFSTMTKMQASQRSKPKVKQ
jgi:hypothetical protein